MLKAAIVPALALGISLAGVALLAQAAPDAAPKVCKLLPITALEKHFGAGAGAVRGADTPTVSSCAVDVPDLAHGADLVVLAQAPQGATVEQRLAAMRQMHEQSRQKVQQFGKVTCFGGSVDMATGQVPTATCYTQEGGYLSLQLRSVDPAKLDFAAVRTLLQQAVALRK